MLPLVLTTFAFACDTVRTFYAADAATGADPESGFWSFPDVANITADVVGPTPPDALPAPAVACDYDAGDAADAAMECPLPPSICADGQWLQYFDDAVCIDGGCAFHADFHYCATGCIMGACRPYVGTAPAPQ